MHALCHFFETQCDILLVMVQDKYKLLMTLLLLLIQVTYALNIYLFLKMEIG